MSPLHTFLSRASACALALCTVPVAAQTPAADPLATLSPEKRAFLSDERLLARLKLTPAKLATALAGRTPAEVDAYAGALMAAVEDAKFKPGRDTAEIQLNPRANGFNQSSTLRPAILDARKRAPGPFSLDRYMFQKGGIPTFAHAPIALRQADLIAGKVDVAFVGVPLDLSSGWRDAKHAPTTLRAMDGLVGADGDADINPNTVLSLADFGDISVDNMAAERSIGHVRAMVKSIAEVGTVPIIVGGDHTLMFPDVAAMADVYGADMLQLIQFDAHPEADLDGDHFVSDSQSLTRLLAGGLVKPGNVTLIGTRGRDAGPATTDRLKAQGVTVHSMAAVAAAGWDAIGDSVLRAAARTPRNVFISFDMSVLDPGAVSASGRPVPGGMTMREAIPLIRRLCRETKVVGFELLDAAPILDPTYVSALSANYVMHACLSGIALRRQASAKVTAR